MSVVFATKRLIGAGVFASASTSASATITISTGDSVFSGSANSITGALLSIDPETIAAIADAVWAHSTAVSFSNRMDICSRILRNKTVTDPSTGVMTVYADDGVTPYLTAQLYENATETQNYRGQGAEVRERLQ